MGNGEYFDIINIVGGNGRVYDTFRSIHNVNQGAFKKPNVKEFIDKLSTISYYEAVITIGENLYFHK